MHLVAMVNCSQWEFPGALTSRGEAASRARCAVLVLEVGFIGKHSSSNTKMTRPNNAQNCRGSCSSADGSRPDLKGQQCSYPKWEGDEDDGKWWGATALFCSCLRCRNRQISYFGSQPLSSMSSASLHHHTRLADASKLGLISSAIVRWSKSPICHGFRLLHMHRADG